MPTTVRSHAKINLGLYIGAPRPDGFHSLVTVYQTVEWHDLVTVTAHQAAATRIKITSNDPRVPTDERNTAWKMVALALEGLQLKAEVEIHIDKKLPVQGGLGAGSGNAVAALIGLEHELASQRVSGSASRQEAFGSEHPNGLWLETTAKVGSDVPLFLIGGAILGLDHGQDVSPLPDIEPTWCVIAVPEIGVSTPQAFRDWDVLCAAEGLTPEASAGKLKELSRAYASAFAKAIPQAGSKAGSSGVISKENILCRDDLAGPQESALVRTGITSWIENDFERVVFPQHPSLREIKRILAGEGTPEAALYASLSGSGSALYGLYRSREDAEAAKERVESGVAGTMTQVTRTLPLRLYWEGMIVKDS